MPQISPASKPLPDNGRSLSAHPPTDNINSEAMHLGLKYYADYWTELCMVFSTTEVTNYSKYPNNIVKLIEPIERKVTHP